MRSTASNSWLATSSGCDLDSSLRRVRGVFVAQIVKPQARVLAESRGIALGRGRLRRATRPANRRAPPLLTGRCWPDAATMVASGQSSADLRAKWVEVGYQVDATDHSAIDKEALMRKFSIRPTLTLKGRTFKGLRGWSGKPLHPPLTDFPIAAYVLAAAFDVISVIGGDDHAWARELLARRHVRVHRRRGGVGVRRAHRVCGTPGSRRRRARRRAARSTRTPRSWSTVTVLGADRHRLAAERLPHRARSRPVGIIVLSVVIALLVSLGRDVRRHPRLRLRLQRRDRRRSPGVAQVGDRRASPASTHRPRDHAAIANRQRQAITGTVDIASASSLSVRS